MATSSLGALLTKYFGDNADTLHFRDQSGKDSVIKELEKRFSLSGDTIVNINNGTSVDFAVFEGVLHSVAGPHLSVRGKGRYVPLFVDTRSPETKAKHQAEVAKLVDNFIERKGYVFRYEHLGDFTLRQSIKNTIAANFLFEGKGDDGQIVFRKFHQGMFSKEFDPNEVIDSYTRLFLDRDRTAESKKQNAFEEKPIAYSKKTLPKYDAFNLHKEFERRALFKHGLPNKEAATLNAKRMIESYRDESIQNLNSFNPEKDMAALAEYETPRESWGIETENKNGYYMPPDML